ncbi:MAG: acyclic terpene utilization AtuA family protein [bacterium]|nr:acyclic terpene utilization AtuA family protein [bacterium]
MKSIRIAAGQGFWGDWLEAPKNQVRQGPIDYLIMDYLAELTMSIMMKQKRKNPLLGYASDFVDLMSEILPDIAKKNIKVLSNAGGVNPVACAKAVREIANKLGIGDKIKIAAVYGDDISGRINELLEKGHLLKNMETGEPITALKDQIQSANVYLGADGMVEALKNGANIIIAGRVTDTGLTLAPMIHEFGWSMTDWDKMATGTIAGHTIECGAQCSGGNCSYQWESIPDMANVGFPIIEAHEDGTFFVTKHEGTGGRIDIRTVKEQLVYEMGDPKSYITPDCIADFSSIQIADAGPNRVKIWGIKGQPKTEFYKVSISYVDGWKAVGTLVYTWPDAVKKAKVAGEILRARFEKLGLKFDDILTELVGVNSCHGALTDSEDPNIPEVTFRIGVRGHDQKSVERFTREIAPLILTGPPSVTGFAGGRPNVQEILAYWPALIKKETVQSVVDYF